MSVLFHSNLLYLYKIIGKVSLQLLILAKCLMCKFANGAAPGSMRSNTWFYTYYLEVFMTHEITILF